MPVSCPRRSLCRSHKVGKFLHATPGHLVLGLGIFQQLVTEMNSSSNSRSLTQHRKVAGSFRDVCLYQIFKIALQTLQQLHVHAIPASEQVCRPCPATW